MASIQETLYAALTADATLTALVGESVYPGEIPEDEDPPPWVFYQVPESTPLDQLDDEDEDVRSSVEFHSLGRTYAEAKAILDAVRDVLNRFRGGSVARAFWEGTAEETTEDGYHHSARFLVFWKASLNYTPPAEGDGEPTYFTMHGFAFPSL